MTETTVGAPALVTELDEERRRYEAWLEQLEARRGATPEHVYARVRNDYLERLDRVVERLSEHAEVLRSGVDELEQRALALRAEEQRVMDDRAEAELRAMVGEYAPERWEQLQADSDRSLGELRIHRGETEGELERLQHLLTLATSGSGRFPSEVPVQPSPVEEAPAMVPETAPEVVTRRDTPPARSLADMAVEPAEPRGSGSYPGVAPATTGGDSLDGWSRDLDAESAPLSAPRHRGDGPVDSGAPAIKTLKCQECGTMNYPTEWYCERCGGELATM